MWKLRLAERPDLILLPVLFFLVRRMYLGHNIIRTNKEHKTLVLKDFQEQDIEAVLQRPAFCQKKHHEKEELKIFCKNCQVAICNTCAVTLHERHSKMLLQEATDVHKSHINSLIESLKGKNQRMSNNAAKIALKCKCKWPK